MAQASYSQLCVSAGETSYVLRVVGEKITLKKQHGFHHLAFNTSH
jgi:hypothetical protein